MSDTASPPSPTPPPKSNSKSKSKPTTSNVKAVKKKAFSCDQCRARKVRCGGEQPSCRRCVVRNDACRYLLAPTISYTQRLEERVRELEGVVEGLRNRNGNGEGEEEEAGGVEVGGGGGGGVSHDERGGLSAGSGSGAGGFDGLKRDEKGGITYHGATSFFQLPAPVGQSDGLGGGGVRSVLEAAGGGGERKERLVSNAWQQRAMETFSETPEPFQFLLGVHWCWIQPLFNFVYRPAFTRDMEVLGSYYSHTLLNAMLSHSVRWCKNDAKIRELLEPYDNGQLFSRQARTLLFDELRQGHSKIPTVQTLLLLSAQECSAGNRTQAWLYSGMAFRLIEDMGICIDGQRYAGAVQLSDEDIEIRHRLFWSCYFWDKMISLYLGRSPTLQHSTVSPPQIMLDDSAETELWKPHGIVYPEGFEYPPTQAHSISCFMRMCQLSEIFNQILIHIYDPLGRNAEAEIQACLASESRALGKWWDDLPTFLRIDAKELPAYCPPSHIVTLNCLYHTFKILLYRPMLFPRSSPPNPTSQRPNPTHLVECISSATSIIAIFDLFCRTFGDDYCILSLSYSVYTAASIFLLQVQAAASGGQDEITMRRLGFCVAVLERVKGINAVIGSSLNLITQALSKLNIHFPTNSFSEPSHQPSNRGDQRHTIQEARFLPLTADPMPSIPDNSNFDLDGSAFQPPPVPLQGFDFENFDISPEMLDAFSGLEPIDATVGALYDFH
ncbi:fungal-specific transcription factor domain-containing protein [Leptodontidium sp. 2 PMI_412]|nr:fungal-specific transcription factor domain-containing protein [Leptodontidium sp. 2 PMI_412]